MLTGIVELLAEHQGYLCQECGFRGKTLHWQCPGCHRWNTVKPIVSQPDMRVQEKRRG